MSGSETPEALLHLEMLRYFNSTGVGLLAMGLFYGFTICSFSCFPVVGPYVFAVQGGFRRSFELIAVFMLSKVMVYVALGAISGVLGSTALELLKGGWAPTLEGALIAAIGVALALQRPRCGCVGSKKPGAAQAYQAAGGVLDMPHVHMAGLGAMTALVPCAPLTAALLACAASKSAAQGALLASLFGLGTLASPLYYAGGAAGWLSMRIATEIPRRSTLLRRLSGAVLVTLGLRLALAGV